MKKINRHHGESRKITPRSMTYMKLVDDTGISDPKRVFVFFKNVSGDYVSGDMPWKSTIMHHGDKKKIYHTA